MHETSTSQPLRRELDLPAAAAWEILTCPDGASAWLGDSGAEGIFVGAAIGVRGVGRATVRALRPPDAIELELDDGSTATIVLEVRSAERSVITMQDGDTTRAPEAWSHLVETARLVTDHVRENRKLRQAIVVVHGIGSQRPLVTARGFTDALVGRSDRWSKPDQLSSSYELRRFQLKRTKRRPRTDIYELYWADKIPGTATTHIVRWVKRQLLRRRRDISPALRPIVYAATATAAIVVATVLGLAATVGLDQTSALLTGVLAGLASLSVLGGAINGFLLRSVGDAARYLDDDPDNIAVRQAIRDAGVTLLRRLHTEGSYDRVVLVGHSLGSVIAYDLIRQYWSEVCAEHGLRLDFQQTALKAFLSDPGTHGADRQKELWEENRRLGSPWLVTDLITLGSPLTHARSLLAGSADDLERRRVDLELPTCPPRGDASGLVRKESYVVDGQCRTIKTLTSGCPFATTRWTNLYAPVRFGVLGDVVGGPVAAEFGASVKDIPVKLTPWWRRRTILAHTAYWHVTDDKESTAVTELRQALDVNSADWLARHVAALPWSMSVR